MSRPRMDAAKLLGWGIVSITLAMAFRTWVEFSKFQQERKRSYGRGLADSLPIKPHPVGDFTFVRIITRANDTNQEYFEVEETATTNSSGFFPDLPGSPPPHRLKFQDRTYTVMDGEFLYLLDGQEYKATAGETVQVPMRKVFTWWVGESAENRTVVRVKYEPAGDYGERVYEGLSGFTRDYGSSATTPYLQMIIWAARQDMEFSFLSQPLRLLCRFVGAPIAMVWGYEATYDKYSTLS